MDSKTRAFLRGAASKAEPIAQIGKEGLSENGVAAIDAALGARELIKVHVLRNADEDARALADSLAEATRSEVVTVIGSKIVLYRKSDCQGVRHILESEKKRDPGIKPNASKKTNFAGEHVERDRRAAAVKENEPRKTRKPVRK